MVDIPLPTAASSLPAYLFLPLLHQCLVLFMSYPAPFPDRPQVSSSASPLPTRGVPSPHAIGGGRRDEGGRTRLQTGVVLPGCLRPVTIALTGVGRSLL